MELIQGKSQMQSTENHRRGLFVPNDAVHTLVSALTKTKRQRSAERSYLKTISAMVGPTCRTNHCEPFFRVRSFMKCEYSRGALDYQCCLAVVTKATVEVLKTRGDSRNRLRDDDVLEKSGEV